VADVTPIEGSSILRHEHSRKGLSELNNVNKPTFSSSPQATHMSSRRHDTDSIQAGTVSPIFLRHRRILTFRGVCLLLISLFNVQPM